MVGINCTEEPDNERKRELAEELLPGVPWEELWRALSPAAEKVLVEQVAKYLGRTEDIEGGIEHMRFRVNLEYKRMASSPKYLEYMFPVMVADLPARLAADMEAGDVEE